MKSALFQNVFNSYRNTTTLLTVCLTAKEGQKCPIFVCWVMVFNDKTSQTSQNIFQLLDSLLAQQCGQIYLKDHMFIYLLCKEIEGVLFFFLSFLLCCSGYKLLGIWLYVIDFFNVKYSLEENLDDNKRIWISTWLPVTDLTALDRHID